MKVLLLFAWAAAVTAAAAATAVTFPQTVEVDLVFPRNETYAPTAFFPIVFAFQNAALVPALDPALDLTLWQGLGHGDGVTLTPIDLTGTNFSGSDPLYVYTFASNLNTTSGAASTPYSLVWSFSAGNCSVVDGATTIGGGFVDASLRFTVAEGGSEADIAAPTDADCAEMSHLAFNVTGVLDVEDPTEQYDGYSTCAVFSEATPTPAGNPCAATADAAVAASVTAALTSQACAAVSPVISCSSTSGASAAAIRMYGAGVWALVMMAIWLGE